MRWTLLRGLSINAIGLFAIAAFVLSAELWLSYSAAVAREPPAAGKPSQKSNALKTAPKKTPPGETATAPPIGLDYSKFELARKEPLRVAPSAFALCRPPADIGMDKQQSRGPHFAPAVKFFANENALIELRSGKTSTMPVGATIVKEKWDNERAKAPLAYAAMIKRESGYDPKHGDWEYVYATLGDKGAVERGRLKSCIDCHATAEKRDYVFRNWLDVKAKTDAQAESSAAKQAAEKATTK